MTNLGAVKQAIPLCKHLSYFLRQFDPPSPAFQASWRGFAAVAANMHAIKTLRERSGAPILEVKSALAESNWNAEQAYQALRKKGLAAAVKKATRRAAEGLVGMAHSPEAAVLVEVNSETDFVARTEEFRSLVGAVANAALAESPDSLAELSREELEDLQLPGGRRAGDAAHDVAGLLRENIQLRRGHRLVCKGGVIGHYLHISPGEGMGRMGALVALKSLKGPLSSHDRPAVEALGKQLAMHVVAARPQFLDKSSVPINVLEGEREVLRQQAAKLNKPAVIIDKMVEGRLQKFYEDACLLDQRFVIDDSQRVAKVLKAASLACGPLDIHGFVRLQCGEGLEEHHQPDFATEVRHAVEGV